MLVLLNGSYGRWRGPSIGVRFTCSGRAEMCMSEGQTCGWDGELERDSGKRIPYWETRKRKAKQANPPSPWRGARDRRPGSYIVRAVLLETILTLFQIQSSQYSKLFFFALSSIGALEGLYRGFIGAL